MDETAFRSLIECALADADTRSGIRGVVKKCIAHGLKRGQIETLFRDMVLFLRSKDREQDEDILIDELDCISGWCHPSHYIEGLDYSDC